MTADYSCDRLQTVIPSSTTFQPDSTMALLPFMIPNSTLMPPSSTLNTSITITPLPFNLRNTAFLNNTMINAHSTTALIPISIATHTFILSIIIRFTSHGLISGSQTALISSRHVQIPTEARSSAACRQNGICESIPKSSNGRNNSMF